MNLLIKNANVIDINKKKTFKGGVVVSGNKISEIFYDDNKIPEEYFERIIDANNNYLTPLFFDVYSKSELAMIKDPSRISSITQGIGMEIIGHGGFSVAPVSSKNYLLQSKNILDSLGNSDVAWRWESVEEYLKILNERITTNVLFYIPLGTMILETSLHPVISDYSIDKINYLLEKSIDEGGVGLSLSVSKTPSSLVWNKNKYIEPILNVLKKRGSILNVNLEGSKNLEDDINRAFDLARQFDLKLHISRCNWGDNFKNILHIFEKRKKDVPAFITDASSYYSCYTNLKKILPNWFDSVFIEEIDSKKIRKEIEKYNEFLKQVRLISVADSDIKKYEGSFLSNIAIERGESIIDFIMNLINDESVLLEHDFINKEDIAELFSNDFVIPSTDGFYNNQLKPDMFGSIPLFLKHIKKDKPYVLVDRLSNITSNFFDINWGLKTGFDANLLIVDIDNFVSKANCINPDSISHGVKEVIINGSLIYSENKMTGIKNGRVFNWV